MTQSVTDSTPTQSAGTIPPQEGLQPRFPPFTQPFAQVPAVSLFAWFPRSPWEPILERSRVL